MITRRSAPSCLDGELSEYAARRLPADRLVAWDRHLIACGGCRAAVEDERALQEQLRRHDIVVPDSLLASLMSLSTVAQPRTIPSVPLAPASALGVMATPIPVLDPHAPAQHRSALRSAVLATVVAAASSAAAFGVSGSVAAAPSGRGDRPVSATTAVPPTTWTLNRAAVLVSVPIGAQSTP